MRWRCRGPPPVPVFSPWLSSVAPGSHGGSDSGVGCRCTRDRPPAARFRQALSQVAAGSPASSGAASRAFPRLSPVWVPRPPVFPWAWLSFWRSIIGLLFPALRPTSPAQGGRSKPPNSPSNTPPHPSPPCRGSRVVPVAVPPRRPCLPGRTPAPHSLCRLSPCAGGCGPRGSAQEAPLARPEHRATSASVASSGYTKSGPNCRCFTVSWPDRYIREFHFGDESMQQ